MAESYHKQSRSMAAIGIYERAAVKPTSTSARENI